MLPYNAQKSNDFILIIYINDRHEIPRRNFVWLPFLRHQSFFARERIKSEHIVRKCPTCLLQTVDIYRLHFIVNVITKSTITIKILWGYVHSTKRNRLDTPDSKVHGANMGPTWVLSAPDGPHVGSMNLVIRNCLTIPVNWVIINFDTRLYPLLRQANTVIIIIHANLSLTLIWSRVWNLVPKKVRPCLAAQLQPKIVLVSNIVSHGR